MPPQTPHTEKSEIVYPDCDGEPIADNTLQFQWLMTIKGGLDLLYRDDSGVFVAGDLLWYPVEGEPTIRVAPDVMLAFGRPKGYRGSYKQWEENNVPPQVVFEILSPGNRRAAMEAKRDFYEQYGVEEYCIYDPERGQLVVYVRTGDHFEEVTDPQGWISPRMQVRFELDGVDLKLTDSRGRRFETLLEIADQRDKERERAKKEYRRANKEHQRAEKALKRAEQESQRAEKESQRAEQERLRAERLAERLRALGVDPDSLEGNSEEHAP